MPYHVQLFKGCGLMIPNLYKVSTTSAPNRLDNFLPSKVGQEVHYVLSSLKWNENSQILMPMLRAEAKNPMEERLKKPWTN